MCSIRPFPSLIPRRLSGHNCVRIRAGVVRTSLHGHRDDAVPSLVATARGMDSLLTALDRPRKSRALSVKFKKTLLSTKHFRSLRTDKRPSFNLYLLRSSLGNISYNPKEQSYQRHRY